MIPNDLNYIINKLLVSIKIKKKENLFHILSRIARKEGIKASICLSK